MAAASVARLARSQTKYDPGTAAAQQGRPRREIAAKMAAASVARLARSQTKYDPDMAAAQQGRPRREVAAKWPPPPLHA